MTGLPELRTLENWKKPNTMAGSDRTGAKLAHSGKTSTSAERFTSVSLSGRACLVRPLGSKLDTSRHRV
jgi:hypothetical protein